MYLTTQKSTGAWLVSTIQLHESFDTVIPLIVNEEDNTIDRFLYIYEITTQQGYAPRALKKSEVENLSGLQYPRRL